MANISNGNSMVSPPTGKEKVTFFRKKQMLLFQSVRMANESTSYD